jgi:hypothetical protein
MCHRIVVVLMVRALESVWVLASGPAPVWVLVTVSESVPVTVMEVAPVSVSVLVLVPVSHRQKPATR